MKCEHGNEIVVIIERESFHYWDDGITTYNADGSINAYPNNSDDEYVRVQCKECKLALIRIE